MCIAFTTHLAPALTAILVALSLVVIARASVCLR